MHEIEAKGLFFTTVVLGAGLIGLCPNPATRLKDLAPSLVGDDEASLHNEVNPLSWDKAAFPPHTIVMPATNHVARDMQIEMAEMMGSGCPQQ